MRGLPQGSKRTLYERSRALLVYNPIFFNSPDPVNLPIPFTIAAMAQSEARHNEPIAVIGSGCRFPGSVTSPSKLWELLKTPRDLVKKVPKDRFNVDTFYHPDGSHHGRTNARYAYFLEEDPYAFDASFFNIPPSEVETVDPQQRLLLETVYESISSAGLKMEDLRGSPTAVYVGMMQRDFLDHQNYDLDSLNIYAATGTSASILSNRVSYVFDWHGPYVPSRYHFQE